MSFKYTPEETMIDGEVRCRHPDGLFKAWFHPFHAFQDLQQSLSKVGIFEIFANSDTLIPLRDAIIKHTTGMYIVSEYCQACSPYVFRHKEHQLCTGCKKRVPVPLEVTAFPNSTLCDRCR